MHLSLGCQTIAFHQFFEYYKKLDKLLVVVIKKELNVVLNSMDLLTCLRKLILKSSFLSVLEAFYIFQSGSTPGT